MRLRTLIAPMGVEIARQWYWAKSGLFAQIEAHFPIGRAVKAEIGPEYEVVAVVGMDSADAPAHKKKGKQ